MKRSIKIQKALKSINAVSASKVSVKDLERGLKAFLRDSK